MRMFQNLISVRFVISVLMVLSATACRFVENDTVVELVTVIEQNDDGCCRKGRADEVMLGAIHFSAQFGNSGTENVHVIGIEEIASIPAGNSASALRLSHEFEDAGVEFNINDFDDEEGLGPSIQGSIFVAVERDNVGSRIMNRKFNQAVSRVERALRECVATTDYPAGGGFYSEMVHIGEQLEALKQYASDGGTPCTIPIGGGGLADGASAGDWFKNLFRNIGHDEIGTSVVLRLGLEPEVFDFVKEFDEGLGETVCGSEASTLHVCPLAASPTLNLSFQGKGADWDLEVNIVSTLVEE